MELSELLIDLIEEALIGFISLYLAVGAYRIYRRSGKRIFAFFSGLLTFAALMELTEVVLVFFGVNVFETVFHSVTEIIFLLIIFVILILIFSPSWGRPISRNNNHQESKLS